MQNGRHMSKSRSGKDLFCRKIITIKVPKQRWSRKYNLLLDFYLFRFPFFFASYSAFLYIYVGWYVISYWQKRIWTNIVFIGAAIVRWVNGIRYSETKENFCVSSTSSKQNFISTFYNVYQKITNLFIAKREEVRFFSLKFEINSIESEEVNFYVISKCITKSIKNTGIFFILQWVNKRSFIIRIPYRPCQLYADHVHYVVVDLKGYCRNCSYF